MQRTKLKVVVTLNIDGCTANIKVKGYVDTRNVQALYAIARRATRLAPTAQIVLDLTAAAAAGEALVHLQASADTGLLPIPERPGATHCNLRVISPARPVFAVAGVPDEVTLAA